MKSPTKLPMFSMRNIICIVGFQCNTVKELLQMRSINSDFKEAVDNHLIDIWYASFNPVNVKHSFNILNSYVVFQLCEVLHKYTTITGMNPAPLFIVNTCPKIDTLMVKYGYVDCLDMKGYVSMTRRDVVDRQTPLVYSCYTQNYKRIQFLLENNANIHLFNPFNILVSNYIEHNDEFVKCIDMFLQRGTNVSSGILSAVEIPWLVAYLIDKVKGNYDLIINEFVSRNCPTASLGILIERVASLEGTLSIRTSNVNGIDMVRRRLDNVILLIESGATVKRIESKRDLMKGLADLQFDAGSAELEKYRMIVRLVSKM